MSIRRSFDAGQSDSSQYANFRRPAKDAAREAFEKAERNRKDGALDWERFQWHKPRPDPVVENNPQGETPVDNADPTGTM